ncbi:MAG: phosphoglucomutase/phosphomannomutase family protein [Elusimicrobia bacterium]|nr:phosphoglucomutase/phosphomannomutase family protein [Elusimicrobiota bacterium]
MIRFGTSGWRGIVSDDFTFQNVRKVAHSVAGCVKESTEVGYNSDDYRQFLAGAAPSRVPTVVVGYDTRFQSEDFAHEVAAVFANDGIRTLLADKDLPTPAVAWAVLANKAVGGVMITASHNPAQYNGFKWMPYWGGSASPNVTNDLERRIELLGDHSIKTMTDERSTREAWIDTVDFRKSYFDQLESLLDVKAIKKAKLKVGIDAMHGSARLYLRAFLEERLGVEVFARNEERDVLLGGISPEPTPESTAALAEQVKKQKLHLGLACDGDGDRFGIVDAGGVWIQPNEVIALAYEHLVVNRGLKGKAARSVMTSHFIDAVAKSHGSETRETPVGFKYLGELLRSGPFLLAGEESGGLSIRGHVPEKDGILACVLMLELVAFEKKPLAAVRDRLFKKLGAFHGARLNYKMDRLRDIIELEARLKAKPPLELAGASVWRIDQADGFKFILRDGAWLGLRSSGTEPVFRVYAEAHTPKRLAEMIDAGKKMLSGKF